MSAKIDLRIQHFEGNRDGKGHLLKTGTCRNVYINKLHAGL